MNLNKNWDLQVDSSIYKDLKKLPGNYTRRILTIIESLRKNPFAGDIQKMKGQKNIWRRRAGEYRIFYEIRFAQKIILVFRVERRTSSTY